MSKSIAITFAACAALLPARALVAQTPPPIILDSLGPPPVLPVILPTTSPGLGVGPGAMNAAGHVVGYGRNAADSLEVAYFWNVAPGAAGSVTPIILAEPGLGARAHAINASSLVVGTVNTSSDTSAAVWNPTVTPLAQPVILPDFGPLFGSAAPYGINASNQIVGAIGNRAAVWPSTGPGTWGIPTLLPDLGTFARAEGINAVGDVFGFVFNPVDNEIHAAVWNANLPALPPDVLANLPGGSSGLGQLIDFNDAGQLVAQVFDPVGGGYAGVLYQPIGLGTWSAPMPLDPSAGLPQVRGLNASGMVVGYAQPPTGGVSQALAWDASSGVPGPVMVLADEGGVGGFAYDINDAGSITGVAMDLTGCEIGDSCNPNTSHCFGSGLVCRQQSVLAWMWPNVLSSPGNLANRPVKLPGPPPGHGSQGFLINANGTVVGFDFGLAVAWHTLDCDDGDVCTVDTVDVTGHCSNVPGNAGTFCRASAGNCDVDDVCDGVSAGCFDDKVPSGAICRVAAGGCDVAETCDGAAVDCPPDALIAAGLECSGSSCAGGIETQAVTCSGASPVCDAPSTQTCDPYACGPDACLTACATDADCQAGLACVNAACVIPPVTPACSTDFSSLPIGTCGATTTVKSMAELRAWEAGPRTTNLIVAKPRRPFAAYDLGGLPLNLTTSCSVDLRRDATIVEAGDLDITASRALVASDISPAAGATRTFRFRAGTEVRVRVASVMGGAAIVAESPSVVYAGDVDAAATLVALCGDDVEVAAATTLRADEIELRATGNLRIIGDVLGASRASLRAATIELRRTAALGSSAEPLQALTVDGLVHVVDAGAIVVAGPSAITAPAFRLTPSHSFDVSGACTVQGAPDPSSVAIQGTCAPGLIP